MSQSSSTSNGTALRYTTTATINCAAYPPSQPQPAQATSKPSAQTPSYGRHHLQKASSGLSASPPPPPAPPLPPVPRAQQHLRTTNNNRWNGSSPPASSISPPSSISVQKNGHGDSLSRANNNNKSANPLPPWMSTSDDVQWSEGRTCANGCPPPPPPPMPPSTGFKQVNGCISNSLKKDEVRSFNGHIKPFSANTNSLPRGFNKSAVTNGGTSFNRGAFTSPTNGTSTTLTKGGGGGGISVNGSSCTLNGNFLSNGGVNHPNKGQGFTNGIPNAIPPASATNHLRRVESSDPTGKPKVDVNDPQVRKLAYNMYRGLLDKKHDKSTAIINSLPDLQVEKDEGVKARVISMM